MNGTRVRKDGRTGTILETRNTPNGQSAKVKMDDRKIASWYWIKDLEIISK